jgi:DNA repair protein RadC
MNNIAEVKLTYITKVKASDREKVISSESACKIFRPFFSDIMEYKEAFYVMYLNKANKVLGVIKLSEGGCSGTVADGKIIFQGGLLANAQAMILCHNHPSGQLVASEADLKLTLKMVEFGKMIDLPILDHIIITEESYYSFADNGKI